MAAVLDWLRRTKAFSILIDLARQTLPAPALIWLRTQMVRNLQGTPSEVFSEIYRRNIWGYSETVSGGGSTLHNTQRVREGLPALLREFDVKTVLDLPCGDLHWMSKIDLPISHYIGGDIVSELVSCLRERFGRQDREFRVLDLCNDHLPDADLLLCRDCFIHLSEDLVFQAIKNIARSNIRYLLTTTFPDGKNRAIRTGDFFHINLRSEPYNLPAPIKMIEDWVPPFDRRYLALWDVGSLRLLLDHHV